MCGGPQRGWAHARLHLSTSPCLTSGERCGGWGSSHRQTEFRGTLCPWVPNTVQIGTGQYLAAMQGQDGAPAPVLASPVQAAGEHSGGWSLRCWAQGCSSPGCGDRAGGCPIPFSLPHPARAKAGGAAGSSSGTYPALCFPAPAGHRKGQWGCSRYRRCQNVSLSCAVRHVPHQ